MFKSLAFTQARLPPRPLLTSTLLSQLLPRNRIHSCHQGAGPTLAIDERAGAETIQVRSPSPEARWSRGRLLLSPALPPRALSFRRLETGWEIWVLQTFMKDWGVTGGKVTLGA